MLFKDTFYTIHSTKEENDTFIFSIELNKDHSIFKGHFPGNPVTPGVAQMEIIKELVQISQEKELSLVSMPSCKFLAILNPEKNAMIDVVLKFSSTEDEHIKMNAIIKDEQTSYLKMSGFYA